MWLRSFALLGGLSAIAAGQISLDLTTIPTPVTPQSLVVGDFNHDGKPDLAVTGSEGSVAILLGNGDGTFRSGQTIAVGAFATRIVKADFNGDGNPDLAVSVGGNGKVMVMLGKADGTFQTPVDTGATAPGGASGGITPTLLAADLTGDGKVDLIQGPYIVSNNSTVLSVQPGNGDGTFRPQVVSSLGTTDGPVPVNYLSDGKTDLFLAGQLLSLAQGTASGSISPNGTSLMDGDVPDDYYDTRFLFHGYHLAVGDVDGDGHSDLVGVLVSEFGAPTFRVYSFLNGGRTSLGSFPNFAAPPSATDSPYMHTTLADLNGDGKADLLLEDPYGNLFVMTGKGDGTFTAAGSFYTGSFLNATSNAGDFYGSLTTADFRGTGKQDVILVLAGKGVVLLKNSSGTVPTVSAVTNSASLRTVAAVAGSLTTIFGTGLSYDTGSTQNSQESVYSGKFALLGSTVTVNGYPSAFLWVSPTQANVQIPWEVAGLTQATVVVSRNGAAAHSITLPLAAYAPAVFAMSGTGAGQAAAVIAGSGIIPATLGSFPGSRPAHAGEYVSFYATGFGAVTEPFHLVTGQLTPGPQSLFPTLATVTASVGGVQSQVQFAGLAPGLLGVYQVNVLIPAGAPTGTAVPVLLSIGGVVTATVTIAIGPG